MSSISERSRNNIRAGIFVTASIVLGLVVVLLLTDATAALFERKQSYTIRFDVASGVRDLQTGSSVRVGGLKMGSVTKVQPVRTERSGMTVFTDEIEVEFQLDARYQLHTDAVIYVAGPLIGADAWLEIVHLGGGPEATLAVDTDEPIAGRAATLVESLLGADGGEIMTRFQKILDDVSGFTGGLEAVDIAEYDMRVRAILDDMKAFTNEAQALAELISHDNWPQWSAEISQFLAWLNEASEDMDRIFAEGRSLLESGNEVLAQNRSRIDSIMVDAEASMASVREVAQRIEHQTMDKIEQVLTDGSNALEQASDLLGEVQRDYPQWSGQFNHTLANATLASQQLKLATQEIRRNPWKLLYQPAPEELEFELLYDAARTFSLALVDLRASAESLQRTLDQHGSILESRPELIDRITQNILNSLEGYDRAQQQLLEVLKLDASGGAGP